MQFLVPLFLAALGALAVPILLHVRRQLPRERVPFSAMMFLDDAAPRMKRRMRLQDLLLLLLRCLGLALLAFAFARPFLGKDTVLAPAPPVEHLILVDTSASMRGEKFERAKREAETLVGKIGTDDIVAVATFDRSLSLKLNFETSKKLAPAERRAAAVTAIRALKPGWFDTNLGALHDAADLADQARETSEIPAVIHVVSDFQRGATSTDLAGLEWPQRTRFVILPIVTEDWTNAGIHPTDSRQATRQVRVTNSDGSQNEAFKVDGQDVEVAPGQSHLVALRGAGNATQAGLTGDAFDFDNRAWFIKSSKTQLIVDYFGPAKPADAQDTLFFLERALQSTPDYEIKLRANTRPDKTAPALTILDGAASLAEAQQRLEAGGNVLLLLRDTASATAVEKLTAHPLRAVEMTPKEPALFGNIDFTNPIFQPFSDPRFSNFAHIHTWRYRRADTTALPGATTLAAFSSGDPALLQVPSGTGTLYILTTTWRPADSQLALSTKFVPLLHSMLRHSAGIESRAALVWVGDEVRLPPGVDGKIRTPDKSVVEAVNGIFAATTEPGIYQSTDGAFSFAVNSRPAESEFTPIPEAGLRALGLPLDKIESAAASEAQQRAMAGEELEHRQKWWWWLIVAAIGIFILESLLAGWTTRRQLNPATA
jgi:hypothetical protein